MLFILEKEGEEIVWVSRLITINTNVIKELRSSITHLVGRSAVLLYWQETIIYARNGGRNGSHL